MYLFLSLSYFFTMAKEQVSLVQCIHFVCFLYQGGEPDVNTVSRMILNDFQRGKLPHFIKPPVNDSEAKVYVHVALVQLMT